MKKASISLLITSLLVLGVIAPQLSGAHSLYIQSGRYQVSTGKSTPLFFMFGHHFPIDDAVRRKKLVAVKVIAPDGSEQEISLRHEKSLHSYLVKYDQPGTYTLTAETKPGYFAMYTDKKGRKRHSLRPMEAFVDNAQSIETSMRSSQWAKTYIVCDKPSLEFPANIGLSMEIIPETDPTQLKPGDTISFTIMNHGQPYEGEGVFDATYGGFSTEAQDMFVPRTTVTDGKFSIKVDHSGRWFVRFFTKNDAPKDMKEQYLTEKRTATLTFLVRNERIRPENKEH
jgi:uncharacterized GH25 family protein